MSAKTSIAWTDATWSPLRARRRDTGKVGQHCERVSEGCRNCYAARHNGRNLPNGGTGLDYVRGSRDLVETFVDAGVLYQPLRWRKPRKVFVENQSDLFGEWVTDEQIDRVFAVMALSEHTFQVLTKRPERMRAWFAAKHLFHPKDDPDQFPPLGTRDRVWSWMCTDDILWPKPDWPLSNVWLGVSVEDQATADERIPELLETPAAVHFLSCEPLLEAVDLRGKDAQESALDAYEDDRKVSWVIVGGESGPKARRCEVTWIRSIVAQCKAAQVPAFVKQLGARPVFPDDIREEDGRIMLRSKFRLHDSKGADPSEWPESLRVQEFPA